MKNKHFFSTRIQTTIYNVMDVYNIMTYGKRISATHLYVTLLLLLYYVYLFF